MGDLNEEVQETARRSGYDKIRLASIGDIFSSYERLAERHGRLDPAIYRDFYSVLTGLESAGKKEGLDRTELKKYRSKVFEEKPLQELVWYACNAAIKKWKCL